MDDLAEPDLLAPEELLYIREENEKNHHTGDSVITARGTVASR